MAGFDPSEPRNPAGSASGGEWRSAAAKKAAATRAAHKAASSSSSSSSSSSKSGMGPARNADAAKAQDAAHKALFDKLMGLKAADRAAWAKGLSDADLEKATEAIYSFKSSDPNVVQARITLANEMSKRGIDIRKHGALGGSGGSSSAPRKRVTPAQARTVARQTAKPGDYKAPDHVFRPTPRTPPSPTQSGGGNGRKRAI